jgi:hypothetical protein
MKLIVKFFDSKYNKFGYHLMFTYNYSIVQIAHDDVSRKGTVLDSEGINLSYILEFLWINKIHPGMASALHKLALRVGRLTD